MQPRQILERKQHQSVAEKKQVGVGRDETDEWVDRRLMKRKEEKTAQNQKEGNTRWMKGREKSGAIKLSWQPIILRHVTKKPIPSRHVDDDDADVDPQLSHLGSVW